MLQILEKETLKIKELIKTQEIKNIFSLAESSGSSDAKLSEVILNLVDFIKRNNFLY